MDQLSRTLRTGNLSRAKEETRMSVLHVEYDDDGYDPGGFSFVDRTIRSIDLEEPEASVVFATVYDDDDELSKSDGFPDEIVEGELIVGVDDYMDPQERRYRRARRCGIVCCFCLFCVSLMWVLGIGIFFAYINIEDKNVEKTMSNALTAAPVPTDSPTAAPVMTRPPSLDDVQNNVSMPELVPIHPSCFVCSDGTQGQEGIFSMTKPNELVFVPPNTMMDSETDMTCEYLQIAGESGLIDPDSCSNLQSQASIKERCGCTSIPGERADSPAIDEVVTESNPEPVFPSCYLCGSKVMGKPLAILTLPSSLPYEESQTCQDVNAIGITGYLPERVCTQIQSDEEIIEMCGCGATGDEEGEGGDVSATTIVSAEAGEFPPCFLCGSEEDSFSNPDYVLSLPGALGNPEELTCADMNNIGKKGEITPEGCVMLQSITDNLEQCGCSNILLVDGSENIFAGDKNEYILREVEYPPCYLCESETDTFCTPDSVPSSLSDFLGYPEGTTCAEIDCIRNEDSITPEQCAITQSDILKQCGCSSSSGV